jgi:pyruvate dehydrogenase E2 component (dihydrolipoamide acetyltransferase)
MAKAFRLPDPGEGIHEAEILDVYVSIGDEVQEGDIILFIETDKAAVEVPSPFTGVVAEIKVKKGDIVQVGDVLMTFTEGKGKEARQKQERPERTEQEERKEEQPAAREAAEAKSPPSEKVESKEEDRETERQERRADRAEDRPVPASPATRRLARELGVDLHEVPGRGPGERVSADDVRAFAGKALEKPEKQEVKEAQEKVARKPAEDTEAQAPKEQAKEAEEERTQEHEEEPETQAPQERAPERRPQRPLVVEFPPLPDFGRWGPVEYLPLSSIRRATAKQMALAWSQIPHVTHQDVADITALEGFRRRHQATVEQQGGKLSLTVFVLQAVVAALKQFPRFNASLDPEAGAIILKHYYHIGVAVDTEQGLIVPVVRDVDRKSLTELATELTALVERVRAGKAKRDEMVGGTFTITNPGPIGGTAFTPIIHYPEVAILGLARARLEPMVEGDLDHFIIVPRLRLPLHLAFDHRVNDGADAARFLRTVIDMLSDPESFILNV